MMPCPRSPASLGKKDTCDWAFAVVKRAIHSYMLAGLAQSCSRLCTELSGSLYTVKHLLSVQDLLDMNRLLADYTCTSGDGGCEVTKRCKCTIQKVLQQKQSTLQDVALFLLTNAATATTTPQEWTIALATATRSVVSTRPCQHFQTWNGIDVLSRLTGPSVIANVKHGLKGAVE